VLNREKLPEEVEEQLQEIEHFLNEGDFEDALDIIDGLVEDYPHNYEVLLQKIRVYKTVGAFSNEVLTLLEKCHASEPTDLEVWMMLVEELVSLGLLALAEKELELIKSSVKDIEKEEDAAEFISSIIAASVQERNEHYGERPDAARLQILLNLAEKSLFLKDFDQALKHIEELTDKAPECAQNWRTAARMHFIAGSFERASIAAKKAIELDKKSGEVYYVLALSECALGLQLTPFPELSENLLDQGISYQSYYLLFSGQGDTLIELYEQEADSVSGHPDAMRFFECLAFVYYMKGDEREALATWQRAVALDPEDSLIAELSQRYLEDSEDDAEVPFVLLGPSEFPHFFSRELEYRVEGRPLTELPPLKDSEISALPHLFSLVLSFGDEMLVRTSLSLILDYYDKISDKEKLHSSMLDFANGVRLSSLPRVSIAHLLNDLGVEAPEEIYIRGRFVIFAPKKIQIEPVLSFPEGSDEELYYSILEESIAEGVLERAEEIGREAFKVNPTDPNFGVEFARTLLLIGKFDEADTVIDKLLDANPKNDALRLLECESRLHENLTKAKDLLEELSKKNSFTTSEYREFQLLSAALALREGDVEKAIHDLDVLEVAILNAKELVS